MKTTKKFLAIILAILMMISIIPITASATTYEGTCGDNVTWTYDDTTCTLTISGTGDMYDYKTNNRPWESYEDKIKTIVIEDGVTTIGENAFYDCEKTINISISDSVISIGKAAFRYCEALENINIPDGITQISDNAFSGCLGLTEIIIPESVTKFGTNAFYNCDGLTEIIIPGSVTEIDEKAFYGCDGLTEIIIPDSVTTIGDYAFEFCSVLECVSFGRGLTTIGTYAFANCNFKNISIPSNITTMGDGVFHGLKNLLSITVDSSNSYYTNDEYGVLYNKDKTTLIQYPIGNSATSYVIPDTVTTIGWRAFNECDSLTDIVIPDSVTTIGLYCFAYCKNLKKVTLGANVTTIDESAFYNPLSTIEFYYNGTSKQWEEMYNNQVEQKELIPYSYVVHCSDKDIYPKCGENVNWIFDFDTGVLKIFGTGDMDDIPYDERPGFYHYPWTYFANKIVEVIICDGVTSVGDNTTCGLENLTKATISYGVTRIGEAAFAGCENLTEITIPDSVTIIGKRAFGGCNNLSVVTMSKNVTEIGDKAFVNCTNLKSCVIPVTVTTLGEMAFYNCSGVTDVYYEGTEEQWSNFIIFTPSGTLNLYPPFKGATMHYNYHIHRNVLASKPVAPTCTEQGYTTYTCDCGDNYVDDYVEALGHTEETIPAVAPTCTETGLTEGTKCSVCGETLTEQKELPANGHTPATAVEENYVAPTCTEKGSKDVVVYCSVCNEEISRETVTLEATGHADNDGDGYCDADNELLDPSVECDHACHKDGISGFIWKIINFFNKLFGLNKTCVCGVKHY